MSNDLTTLSGALLEMKEQLIYELGQKGVTASYSSSDGLLGLIGKISEIQTGGGTPVIQFNNTNFGTHFAFTRPYSSYKDTFVVNVPSTVTNIDDYCFYYLYNMTDVNLPNGLTKIGGSAFYYCQGLTSLTLPNSITSLGTSAFYYCTGLTSINIPTSVTSLPSNCFRYCTSLTELTIPSNVTSIGSYAIGNCTGLTKIRFERATPPTASTGAFNSLPTSCVIEVPCDSLSLYTSASNYPSSSTYTYVPYGCNGLKFLSDTYTTTTTGSCEVSLRLWDNDAPVSGGTITITGSDSSTYTCTTDSNGEATCTVSNVSGTVTFTATYNNYTATCTVTYRTGLFSDPCNSATGLSNYGSSVLIRGSNATITMTYDSTENAYKLSGSGNYHAMIPIPVLNDEDNYKITADIKGQNKQFNSIGFYLDNRNDTTSYGEAFFMSIYSKELLKRRYRVSGDGSYSTTSISSLSANTYYRLEVTVEGSSLTGKLYNGDTLLGTQTDTLEVANKMMGIFLYCEAGATNSVCYIKNIEATPIS